MPPAAAIKSATLKNAWLVAAPSPTTAANTLGVLVLESVIMAPAGLASSSVITSCSDCNTKEVSSAVLADGSGPDAGHVAACPFVFETWS